MSNSAICRNPPKIDPVLSALTFFLCLTMIFAEACKKGDSINGPPSDDTSKAVVLNRILLSVSDPSVRRGLQICSIDADGSGFRRITYPLDSISYLNAVWSPNARHWAVIWDYYDARHREYPRLSLADTVGNFITLVSDVCLSGSPLWSPDGAQIVFSVPAVYGGSSSQVYVASAQGGTPRPVTHFAGLSTIDTSAFAVRWLSNNELLTIVDYDSADTKRWSGLFEMDLAGNLTRRLFEDPDKRLHWADTNGDLIICTYWRRGSITGLLSLHKADSTIQYIREELFYLQTKEGYGGPRFSPDGQQFAFCINKESPSTSTIVVRGLASGNEQVLLRSSSAYVSDWR